MSYYEPTRKAKSDTISGILPATAQPIGIALMIGSVDADTGARTFVLANGKSDGLLTRASRVSTGNPRTDSELLWNQGLETPFRAGYEGSIEKLEEFEVEGGDYIVKSGTGAITTETSAGTELSWADGKVYAAQAGDYAECVLVAQLTSVESTGDVRLRVKFINGGKVPA